MKNTVKRISILASAFLMAVSSCFTAITASGADKSIDLTSGYASETINLSDAQVIAGNQVMVQLSLNTGNQCMGYNLDIEFDSRLTLKSVEGAMSWETIGNVLTIIGFSPVAFQDGRDIATLIFETPENAPEGAAYDIGVKSVDNLAGLEGNEIQEIEVKNSTVEVVESAKNVTNHISIKSAGRSALGLRGDSDDNGKVDVYDAIKIAKYMLKTEKLDGNAKIQADVNEDGQIDIYDAVNICKYTMAADKSNAWESIIK